LFLSPYFPYINLLNLVYFCAFSGDGSLLTAAAFALPPRGAAPPLSSDLQLRSSVTGALSRGAADSAVCNILLKIQDLLQ
jgi:hypothetical protein